MKASRAEIRLGDQLGLSLLNRRDHIPALPARRWPQVSCGRSGWSVSQLKRAAPVIYLLQAGPQGCLRKPAGSSGRLHLLCFTQIATRCRRARAKQNVPSSGTVDNRGQLQIAERTAYRIAISNAVGDGQGTSLGCRVAFQQAS